MLGYELGYLLGYGAGWNDNRETHGGGRSQIVFGIIVIDLCDPSNKIFSNLYGYNGDRVYFVSDWKSMTIVPKWPKVDVNVKQRRSS